MCGLPFASARPGGRLHQRVLRPSAAGGIARGARAMAAMMDASVYGLSPKWPTRGGFFPSTNGRFVIWFTKLAIFPIDIWRCNEDIVPDCGFIWYNIEQ